MHVEYKQNIFTGLCHRFMIMSFRVQLLCEKWMAVMFLRWRFHGIVKLCKETYLSAEKIY